MSEYNYILVFAPSGPKFVTEIDYNSKECFWDGTKAPLEMSSLNEAKHIAFCMTINGNYAVAVNVQYKIEEQPFNYKNGFFKWQDKTA